MQIKNWPIILWKRWQNVVKLYNVSPKKWTYFKHVRVKCRIFSFQTSKFIVLPQNSHILFSILERAPKFPYSICNWGKCPKIPIFYFQLGKVGWSSVCICLNYRIFTSRHNNIIDLNCMTWWNYVVKRLVRELLQILNFQMFRCSDVCMFRFLVLNSQPQQG